MRATFRPDQLRWLLAMILVAVAALAVAPRVTSAPPLPPTILAASPNVIRGFDVPDRVSQGTFTLRGKFLQDGRVFTNGPLALASTGDWNRNEGVEVLTVDYRFGCCAAFHDQVFDLIVVTPFGHATVPVTIRVR